MLIGVVDNNCCLPGAARLHYPISPVATKSAVTVFYVAIDPTH
jgi:hypothetical protein